MTGFWDSIKRPSKIFDIFGLSKSKQVNESGVVKSLLENLELDHTVLATTPQYRDPPDCIFVLKDETIGIEVVGLIDNRARTLSAKARKRGATEYYVLWTTESFRSALENLAASKGLKITKGIVNGMEATNCQKFWLVIHADEFTLTSGPVRDFLAGWKLSASVFERIFLVLSYEAGISGNGYPCFELSSVPIRQVGTS